MWKKYVRTFSGARAREIEKKNWKTCVFNNPYSHIPFLSCRFARSASFDPDWLWSNLFAHFGPSLRFAPSLSIAPPGSSHEYCIYGAQRNITKKASDVLKVQRNRLALHECIDKDFNNLFKMGKWHPPTIIGWFQLYKKQVYYTFKDLPNAAVGDYLFCHKNFFLSYFSLKCVPFREFCLQCDQIWRFIGLWATF